VFGSHSARRLPSPASPRLKSRHERTGTKATRADHAAPREPAATRCLTAHPPRPSAAKWLSCALVDRMSADALSDSRCRRVCAAVGADRSRPTSIKRGWLCPKKLSGTFVLWLARPHYTIGRVPDTFFGQSQRGSVMSGKLCDAKSDNEQHSAIIRIQ